MVAHTFNPSTWEAETGRSLEFAPSLVYNVSSKMAGARETPVQKKKKERKKEKKKKKKRKEKENKKKKERKSKLGKGIKENTLKDINRHY